MNSDNDITDSEIHGSVQQGNDNMINKQTIGDVSTSTVIGSNVSGSDINITVNQCPQELIDIFIKIANLLESINTLLYSK